MDPDSNSSCFPFWHSTTGLSDLPMHWQRIYIMNKWVQRIYGTCKAQKISLSSYLLSQKLVQYFKLVCMVRCKSAGQQLANESVELHLLSMTCLRTPEYRSGGLMWNVEKLAFSSDKIFQNFAFSFGWHQGCRKKCQIYSDGHIRPQKPQNLFGQPPPVTRGSSARSPTN